MTQAFARTSTAHDIVDLIAMAQAAVAAALQAEGAFELASLNFEALAQSPAAAVIEARVVLDRVTRSLAFATAELVDRDSGKPVGLVRTVWRRKLLDGQ